MVPLVAWRTLVFLLLLFSAGMSFFWAVVCDAFVLCVGLFNCKALLCEVGACSEGKSVVPRHLSFLMPTALGKTRLEIRERGQAIGIGLVFVCYDVSIFTVFTLLFGWFYCAPTVAVLLD